MYVQLIVMRYQLLHGALNEMMKFSNVIQLASCMGLAEELNILARIETLAENL